MSSATRAAMTAKQRRERTDRLQALATQQHLKLAPRERTKGAYVWDAVDARSGMVAARGLRLDALERYLGGE